MVNDFFLQVYLRMMNASRREDGQGALEYMAMAVAMITLIYAGFRLLGTDLLEEAEGLVDKILGDR